MICSDCKQAELEVAIQASFNFGKMFGVDKIRDLPILRCPSCEAIGFDGEAVEAAEKAIGKEIQDSNEDLKPGEAIFLRKSLGLDRKDLAFLLDVSVEEVEIWEKQEEPLTAEQSLKLRALVHAETAEVPTEEAPEEAPVVVEDPPNDEDTETI